MYEKTPQHEIVKRALNKVAMKHIMTVWYQQRVGKTEGEAKADSGGRDKENWLGRLGGVGGLKV